MEILRFFGPFLTQMGPKVDFAHVDIYALFRRNQALRVEASISRMAILKVVSKISQGLYETKKIGRFKRALVMVR